MIRSTGNNSRIRRCAFTLIELLAVVSIVALLISILLPSLSGARGQARAAVCASNIRQLVIANQLYADENSSRACPGAARFMANLDRWHGTRGSSTESFDSSRGPLVPYLGPDRTIRNCPTFRGYLTDEGQAFELGSGGYGYNNAFLGRQLVKVIGSLYQLESDEGGALMDRVRSPSDTISFADTAFAGESLIEYSFAEPRFSPTNGYRADPSIHFRHAGAALAAWCDGHVDRRSLSFTWSSGLYSDEAGDHKIGWFGGPDDNSFFDLD